MTTLTGQEEARTRGAFKLVLARLRSAAESALSRLRERNSPTWISLADDVFIALQQAIRCGHKL
jgi:hypothetical protein